MKCKQNLNNNHMINNLINATVKIIVFEKQCQKKVFNFPYF